MVEMLYFFELNFILHFSVVNQCREVPAMYVVVQLEVVIILC